MAKHAPHRVYSAYREQSHFIRPTAAALAVAACFSGPVLANPTNPTVVHGTATFATAGNILNITNGHNAIINWGSFSIGVNELTRFIQPSALSAVLNRVIGQDPSAILGALQSNGRVFLLNPNGIVFGAGAQINVAGLVASTLNLSNDDFLNNRMRFTDGAGAGSVVNQGSITGGNVYLVGKSVSNEGLITSPNGEVVLAAGNSVELVNPGTPNLRVEVVAPDNEARNLGTISAEAGRIGIYAGLITNSGTLNASSAVAEGGKILLKATRNTTLEAGSQTMASGTTGGTIAIQSGDTTLVLGTIEAKGSAGNGGTVQVLGNLVGLIDAASVDASGVTGGGTVLVGGDYQGKNPDIQNAYRAYVGPNATIKADAVTEGNGGKVVVWSDDATRYYGNISARGGAVGGNGGFVEVSGKRWLDYRGLADTRAPKGLTGTLLLDPDEIVINNGVTSDGGFDGPFYPSGGETSNIAWSDIVDQLVFSNAIISTSGSYGGDIRIAGNSPDLNSVNTLDLRAHNNIFVDGSISNTDIGNIVMYAGYNGSFGTPGVNYGVGSIAVNAPISTNGEVWLNAGGSIMQDAAGAISASKLLANSSSGPVALAAAMNQVDTLAGAAIGMFAFKNSGNLAIGSVGSSNGITVNPGAGRHVTVNVEVSGGQLTVNSPVNAYGGDGGEGQAGGNATITLASSSSMQINSSITADGGEGGDGYYSTAAGNGGNATVNLTTGGGLTVAANVQATGGTGGYGSSADGGRGGDGVVNANAVGTLSVSGAYGGVIGQGGQGGYSYSSYGGTGGRGGDGKVMLSAVGGITIDSGRQVRGTGGNGGDGGSYSYSGSALGGNGGDGIVQLTSTGGSIGVSGLVRAQGGSAGYGDGGETGMGGNALVLMSSSSGITLTNSEVEAVGGDAYDGTGGAAAVTMLAGSNIQMEGAEGSADGGNGVTGGNATVLLVAGGNITVNDAIDKSLQADVSGQTPGLATMVLAAAGNLSLGNGAEVQSDGTVGLAGANIVMDNAYVNGDTGVSVGATGSLSVMNGSELYSEGNAYITTGGNVTVDNSYIYGTPEVVMNVGGVINMNNLGTIEAGSPSTILLTFPMLTGGGFFVNGLEGVVYDSGTGFVVLGDPAILGTNLLVTYGGSAPPPNIPTNTLIVAMGESTEPPDAEKNKDVFEDLKKDEEKEAPVCR